MLKPLKTDGDQHQAVMVVSHLICDAVTLSVLNKDRMNFYHNPERPVEKPTAEYASYVREVLQFEQSDILIRKHLELWKERLRYEPMTCPADWQKGENTFDSQETYDTTIGFEELGIGNENRMFEYLSVGLYGFLSEWAACKTPAVSHMTHRRNLNFNEDYYGVAGFFAGRTPMFLNTEQSVGDRLTNFRRLFDEIPAGGVTYEILCNLGLLPEAHEIAPVLLNYIPFKPEPHIIRSGSEFMPDKLNRLYLLRLIVMSEGDSLSIRALYSNNFHKNETIEAFVRGWTEKIREAVSADERTV